MKNKDIRSLADFLDNPARPEGTLRFHELQGFLFAIASSPQTIAPSDWLPMIGNEEDLLFTDNEEAQEILGLLMAVYNEVNEAVIERSNALPPGCAFADDIAENIGDDVPISQWASGFTQGHDWLTEVWEDYLYDDLDEEFGAALMALSFFGSRRLADAYHAEMAPGRRKKGGASFEDFARTMRDLFPDALAYYASLGRTIFEVVSKRDVGDNEPARSIKIGRNAPCPCGSGKKYKKCCGARLH